MRRAENVEWTKAQGLAASLLGAASVAIFTTSLKRAIVARSSAARYMRRTSLQMRLSVFLFPQLGPMEPERGVLRLP